MPNQDPDQASKLSLLERREIEARIVGPIIRAFAAEIGQERALAILAKAIAELAREQGKEAASALGEATLQSFASILPRWCEGGALELVMLHQGPDRLDFNVTRCRYAEMYRSLGLADLGTSLSCIRDAALIEGFNPDLQLIRSSTIMEGAQHCDFRFRKKEPQDPESPS